MDSPSVIIQPDELMREVPLEIQQLVQPHLLAIYDERPDQVGTAFLTLWHGKPLIVTARHTLFGKSGNDDPFAKQIHVDGDLRLLRDVSLSRIESNKELDVAIMHVGCFDPKRCLPYTGLQFATPLPGMISIVGFLARDFHRSKSDSVLMPKPYCYTNNKIDLEPQFVGLKYTNRGITTETGRNEMAPIPRGLSGTLMVSTPALLLKKVNVIGVFTEERLSEGHVFGTHVSALCPLMDSLLTEGT